jgi:fermentation-respiration switch protein FrsA (DUF1100 family)
VDGVCAFASSKWIDTTMRIDALDHVVIVHSKWWS